jgi:pilus assembly protein CpaF
VNCFKKEGGLDINTDKLINATNTIRELLSHPELFAEEEREKIARLQKECTSGDRTSINEMCKLVANYLVQYNIDVDGMTPEEVAWDIYKSSWGQGPIEDIYNAHDSDEVEVVDENTVYTIRHGKYKKENVRFNNREELWAVIKRQIGEIGDLTLSSPQVRTIRADGTRVFATSEPFTSSLTLTSRKHNTFKYSRESLEEVGTMETRIYDMLAIFNRGLLNILYSGSTNTGKTSMLRHFFGYRSPDIRTVTIEPRFELKLKENYPGWNIIEFQEVPQARLTMLDAFKAALQITPVSIIVGEILGEEVPEAVKASLRGHSGNLSTFHAENIIETLDGLAMCLVEEGHSQQMNMDLALRRVSKAYDVIVNLFSPPTSGIKKVVHIAEPFYSNGEIQLNDLVVWEPDEEDYLKGKWIYPNPISEKLVKKLHRNGISINELKERNLVW